MLVGCLLCGCRCGLPEQEPTWVRPGIVATFRGRKAVLPGLSSMGLFLSAENVTLSKVASNPTWPNGPLMALRRRAELRGGGFSKR